MTTREPTGDATRSPEERHVICVDDDVEFLRSLEFFLPGHVNASDHGLWYRFAFFDDPAVALETLRELKEEGEPVAMLISDQMMPVMKGTEFLGRAREVTPESIRVLLTGHAGIESAITAINERLLDRYLTKPVESEQEFTLNVRQLLQKFELQRTIEDQSQRIHQLYEFANTLNAKEGMSATLQSVADFSHQVLGCDHVTVIADAEGEEAAASAGKLGPGLRVVPVVAGRAAAFARMAKAGVGMARSWSELPALEPADSWTVQGGVLYGVCRMETGMVGLIVAMGPPGQGFTDEHAQIMRFITSTASVALHNQINRSKLQLAWETSREQAVTLAEANQRLHILDRMKSDFLSFISHELRTPLSAMSAIEMIDHASTPGDAQEMAEIGLRGYKRLQRFIDKGLEYFSWLAANREVEAETTDLAEALRRVIASVKESTPEIDCVEEIGGPCLVTVGQKAAEEISHVLLDNAVKFASGKPVIRVSLVQGSTHVQLMVQDRGRGFPIEWAKELFKPFTIAESMRHREGTALNLAKVAAMVGAHGGEIRAHSGGFGQGATFIVELPNARPQEASEEERAAA